MSPSRSLPHLGHNSAPQRWEGAREAAWVCGKLSGELGQDALCQRVLTVGIIFGTQATRTNLVCDWWPGGLLVLVFVLVLVLACLCGCRREQGQGPVELGCLSSRGLVRWLDDSQHAGETDQPRGLRPVWLTAWDGSSVQADGLSLGCDKRQHHLCSALFCSPKHQSQSCRRADLLVVAEGCLNQGHSLCRG